MDVGYGGPTFEAFGRRTFYYEPTGALHATAESDVHRFRRVVARDEYWDYAWLELSETIAGVTAPGFRKVHDGELILGATHAAGLPAKILASTAMQSNDGFFSSTFDAFGGASGAPVFSQQGDLVGVLSTGAPDYDNDTGGEPARLEARGRRRVRSRARAGRRRDDCWVVHRDPGLRGVRRRNRGARVRRLFDGPPLP